MKILNLHKWLRKSQNSLIILLCQFVKTQFNSIQKFGKTSSIYTAIYFRMTIKQQN